MKPKSFDKPRNIGRRKKLSLFVKRCDHLSDRGFNVAIEVYELNWQTGRLCLIGSDYAISSASWKGDDGAGINVLELAYPDLKHDEYRIKDSRVISYQVI